MYQIYIPKRLVFMPQSVKANYILNLINTGTQMLFPLITFPYACRVIQADGIGQVNFFSSIIGYISLFTALGIPMYGIREIARDRNNVVKMNRTAVEILLLHMLLTVLGYIAVAILCLTVPQVKADIHLFWVLSLTIFFTTIGCEWFYQGIEDFKYITVRGLIVKSISMLLLFAFVKTKDDLIYYVCSKNSLRPSDDRVHVLEVEGTLDLKNTLEDLLLSNEINYFIHSMAVSDYMTDFVTNLSNIKESITKSSNIDEAFENIEAIKGNKISSYEDNLVVVLKPTPKIISIIKNLSPSTYLVGFKLLDGVSKLELINTAKKLRDKNRCDLVVANDLSSIRNGEHIAYIIDNDNNVEEVHGKIKIAEYIVRRLSYGK